MYDKSVPCKISKQSNPLDVNNIGRHGRIVKHDGMCSLSWALSSSDFIPTFNLGVEVKVRVKI